jgi:cytoskeletal protein RodZ
VNRKNPRSGKRLYQGSRAKTKRVATQKRKINKTKIKDGLNSLFIWVLVVINVILVASMVHKLITPATVPDSTIPQDYIDPLKVEVWNGCGISGLASEFAEFLQREKYDVVNVTNAPRFDFEVSLVIDRGRKDEKRIKALCESIGISEENIRRIANAEMTSDATFIIGHDYASLKAYKQMH